MPSEPTDNGSAGMPPQDLEQANQRLARARERDRKARQRAEELLEERSRQLYTANEALQRQNADLAHRNAQVELLNDVAFIAQEERSLRDIMQRFLAAVCRKCNWGVGHVYVLSRSEQLVSLKVWHLSDSEAGSAFRQATEETTFAPGDGLPGQVQASGEPVWIENILERPSYPRHSFAEALGVRFGYGLPISIYNRPVAVAEFYAPESYIADTADLNMVEVAAVQLGTALERLQAERELKQNNRELKKALNQLKQAQTQLVHAEKMVGLGELSAGIAHEINTPVGYVMSNVRTLARYTANIKELFAAYEEFAAQEHSPASATSREKLAEMRTRFDLDFMLEDLDALVRESNEGMARITEIVQGLQNFARTDEAELKEADINEGLESTLRIVWNDLKYKCEVERDLGELPPLVCYAGQLNQVFLNLLKNAGQAIESQGTIRLSSHATPTHIIVQVADSGSGIAPEHIPKLFDPFFTTKEVGKGTGLGLAISHGIIEKHGGEISVESEIGKGTVFTISLPIERPATL